MKIVVTDNFDREYKSDYVYVEYIVSEDKAKHIARALNRMEHDQSPSYFLAVADDYKLTIFEP